MISSHRFFYFILFFSSGDFDSAVELLEEIYMNPNSTHPSMSFVFRKVLESGNDKALDKCKTPRQRLIQCVEKIPPANRLMCK